ncbi:thioredoxin family protein [Pararhodospirillum photometricum]|uniref:Thiol-disulfide isomerase and thioredoxins n=1 Tax=Pararhodospirillum photometricum DSM 122 TaxID=1150469 RepID=H6SLV3_PARPM|nr:thioredoxin family protein [Pararhodospirillum photometricum]CCG08968.1 Thiol-disulfide isomerase and thioredoxins [Pararhodospirillum photometricum DSM 122]
MKSIKVLGSGCKTCVNTAKLIEDKARALGVAVEIEKVTDMAVILGHGVMRTPGVVVEGKVVHAGGMPLPEAVEAWLKA